MARMVFSGMFDKLPKLKIITHHLGAMVPFFVDRVGYGMDQFGSPHRGRGLRRRCSSA